MAFTQHGNRVQKAVRSGFLGCCAQRPPPVLDARRPDGVQDEQQLRGDRVPPAPGLVARLRDQLRPVPVVTATGHGGRA
ncbi:hypothetical protein [Streptomyces sp. MMBL 11-3]|uniref:hypothetical protein n=1 Tax=Streptomyces sp. MMBL 11-3 TaxID=3382639 RepID=UPI0039B4074F